MVLMDENIGSGLKFIAFGKTMIFSCIFWGNVDYQIFIVVTVRLVESDILRLSPINLERLTSSSILFHSINHSCYLVNMKI